MALRDIFKFRDLPEGETSKPFLEHLEDLRWTIVKMAITLAVAMIVCFAFRSTLVRILQAPLRDVGSGAGSIWFNYLRVHGTYAAVCSSADLCPGDHHHAHARYPDLDRNGAADVSAL